MLCRRIVSGHTHLLTSLPQQEAILNAGPPTYRMFGSLTNDKDTFFFFKYDQIYVNESEIRVLRVFNFA